MCVCVSACLCLLILLAFILHFCLGSCNLIIISHTDWKIHTDVHRPAGFKEALMFRTAKDSVMCPKIQQPVEWFVFFCSGHDEFCETMVVNMLDFNQINVEITVCVCTCMRVCVRVCVYMYLCVCTCMCVCACVCACVHVHYWFVITTPNQMQKLYTGEKEDISITGKSPLLLWQLSKFMFEEDYVCACMCMCVCVCVHNCFVTFNSQPYVAVCAFCSIN